MREVSLRAALIGHRLESNLFVVSRMLFYFFTSAVHLVNLACRAHQVKRCASRRNVLQTDTARLLVAASSVAQTLKVHPIPRRCTTVSATSAISVQMVMHKRELLAVQNVQAIRAPGSEGPRSPTALATSTTTALMG